MQIGFQLLWTVRQRHIVKRWIIGKFAQTFAGYGILGIGAVNTRQKIETKNYFVSVYFNMSGGETNLDDLSIAVT